MQIEDDWISTIWLDIIISRNQHMMLMCGYCELKYLKETGITGSGTSEKQREQLKLI